MQLLDHPHRRALLGNCNDSNSSSWRAAMSACPANALRAWRSGVATSTAGLRRPCQRLLPLGAWGTIVPGAHAWLRFEQQLGLLLKHAHTSLPMRTAQTIILALQGRASKTRQLKEHYSAKAQRPASTLGLAFVWPSWPHKGCLRCTVR